MTTQVSTVWELFNQLDLEEKNQFLSRLVDSFYAKTDIISPELKSHIETRHLASIRPDAAHYDWSEAKVKVKEALVKYRNHA